MSQDASQLLPPPLPSSSSISTRFTPDTSTKDGAALTCASGGGCRSRCASGGSHSSTEMLHGAQTSLWNSRLPTAGENLDEPFGVASEVWKDSLWLFERV